MDYLPHALESWLAEEERSPRGKRRNLSLVEADSGRTVGYQCIYFMDNFTRQANSSAIMTEFDSE